MLRARDLEVTIHPSDVAMAGSKEAVARARAAVANRLTKTQAYLTASKEAQEVEDALRALRDRRDHDQALAAFERLDGRLATLIVPYEEWEVLYRQRLQVERDLLQAGVLRPPTQLTVVDRVKEKVAGLIG